MKIKFLFIIIVILCVYSGGCTQKEVVSQGDSTVTSPAEQTPYPTAPEMKWGLYVSPDQGFSVNYPPEFNVDTLSSDRVRITSPQNCNKTLLSYWASPGLYVIDMSSPFYNSSSGCLWEDIFLIEKSMATSYLSQYPADQEFLKRQNPNIRISVQDITIDGVPAKQEIIEEPGQPYWVKNYLLYDGNLYVISYGEYLKGSYQQRSDIMSHMINSMKMGTS